MIEIKHQSLENVTRFRNYIGMFSELVRRQPYLNKYTRYLSAPNNHSFERIARFCDVSGFKPEDFQNNTVVDIAGGNVLFRDSEPGNFSFFPWFNVAAHLLGADAINIDYQDENDLEDLNEQTTPDFSNLLRHIRQTQILINYDLVANIGKPEKLITKLKNTNSHNFPGAVLVNCNFFVTQSNPLCRNSPDMLDRLGIERAFLNTPAKTKETYLKLSNLSGDVFTVAAAALKNLGYLYFNDEIYQKIGDKFIWVPGMGYLSAVNAYRKLSDEIPKHPFENQLLPEQSFQVLPHFTLVVNQGKWELDHSSANDFAPVP
jgi:hypothetical protein